MEQELNSAVASMVSSVKPVKMGICKPFIILNDQPYVDFEEIQSGIDSGR